jgi:hypothetical protein
MRANNKSSRNGDQSILHPNHYFVHGLQTSYSNSWSTSLDFKQSFVKIGSKFPHPVSKFENKIYRFLTRVLGKLCRKAKTLALQILRLAISSRNIIHSTRLSLTLTSPYNIYYKAVIAYKFFQIGYILLCFLPCTL